MKILKFASFGLFSLCLLVTLKATNPELPNPKLPNDATPNIKIGNDLKPNMFQNQGLTFFFGSGNAIAQRVISDVLDEQVQYDFPNKATNIINAPAFIGYQYHVKKRLSIGLIYCTSGVATPNLSYPDFQNPGQTTEFNYQVNINSFMGSVDYHWYFKTGNKSALSLHSGLALGVYDVNFRTQIVGGNGQNLPEYNLSTGSNGWQITLIGVKQSFYYKLLKNFGYMANLGVGMNVIGLSVGATYTL